MLASRDAAQYDLVVVGAGLYGLCMARTYLQVNPSARVLVLDAGQTIGGTWSAERVYDGLRTNNMLGTMEYSDYPMDPETFGVEPGMHVPGDVVHRYLKSYAQHFGVWDRIQFGAVVKSAELNNDKTWHLKYVTEASEKPAKPQEVIAMKLVLATGTTSTPVMPNIPGSTEFRGSVFHFKDMPKMNAEIEAAERVAVLGGSKSAADAIWINASNGRHVDWIIRESGRGPAWLASPFVTPAKFQFEKLALTRFVTFFNPCFNFDGYSIVRKFLHNTSLGRLILRGFFAMAQKDMIETGQYCEHPETQKLVPVANPFWFGSTVAVFNYPTDLFQLIREGKIHVHRADVTSLSSSGVHLSNGNTIDVDILICATGWDHKPTVSFLPEEIADKVGVAKIAVDSQTVQAADAEIFRRFPDLKDQPSSAALINAKRDGEHLLYLLYRGTVPPAFMASHNFAFCGQTPGLRSFLIAQVQALWVTALLDGRLTAPLPSVEEAEWDALLQSRFYRWRAPHGLGLWSADMVFEVLPFLDTLLRDLGLKTRRKGGWKELFEGYGVDDYRNLVDEWLHK